MKTRVCFFLLAAGFSFNPYPAAFAQAPVFEKEEAFLFLAKNAVVTSETKSLEVRYRLPRAGKVSISIYNSAGERVRLLLETEIVPDKEETVSWDLKNDQAEPVASGVYLVHLEAPGWVLQGKVLIVR